MRIVFDCFAKCEGLSLKDAIRSDPKLQNEFFDVLVRFRRNPVALACDKKEMYSKIEIEEKDRSLFRILWRMTERLTSMHSCEWYSAKLSTHRSTIHKLKIYIPYRQVKYQSSEYLGVPILL